MYYFIVNPNSRSGRGRFIWNEIHQQLMLRGVDFQYCLTRYSGHATEIASKACLLGTASKPVYIIALGGDGTIHEVLTGITDFDRVVFGYIPTGSGNDFCRSMGLPFDPMESLEYILKAEHIGHMDIPYLLRGNKKSRFGISTGMGFDAGVCQEVLATPFKKIFNRLGLGKLIYLFIALKQLIFISPGKMTLNLDHDKSVSYDHVYFTAVMNQKYEGGGFKFCPAASPSDGYLDIIVVDGLSKPRVLLCLPTAFFGKHTHFHGIHIFRCKEVTIHSDVTLPVHKDGESAGLMNDFSASMESQQINIIS